jgi:Tfp pilus assembly PilM family ATPase
MVILFDGRCVYPRTVFAYSTSWEDGVDHLIDSLRDMFRYQQFKLREAPVSSVLLTGLVPGCDGFVDRIGKSLGVPVRLWSPASDVKAVAIGPSSGVEKYTSTASMMSCAMGLALRRET